MDYKNCDYKGRYVNNAKEYLNAISCGLFLFFAVSINSNKKKYKIDEINKNYNRNNTIYYIYK